MQAVNHTAAFKILKKTKTLAGILGFLSENINSSFVWGFFLHTFFVLKYVEQW